MFNKKRKNQKIALAYILNHLGEGIIDVRKRLSKLEERNFVQHQSKGFKKGDKVFDIHYGWGVVKEDNNGNYPVVVSYKTEYREYNRKGVEYGCKNPSLSHHQYGLNTKPNDYK